MRLISVHDLREGMILGKSIYLNNNQLLLGAGYRVTPDIVGKLGDRGYSHVYIMEEGTEEVIPEDIISDEVRHQAKVKLSGGMKKIQEAFKFQDMSQSKAVDLMEKGYLHELSIMADLRRVVEDILKEISAVGAKFLNTVMIKSRDTYFLDHAINTTVLAIIIGKKYRFTKKELTSLALGTFLHDIGKVVIDQMAGEDAVKGRQDLYAEHPTFGYLLLRDDPLVTPLETQIVNQHHEHQDGSGFPIGLKGQNLPPTRDISREPKGTIFRFAEIVCVVNAYDNMVLNPRNGYSLSPQDVIRRIVLDAGTKYNNDIVDMLCSSIAVFPVGTYIKVINIVDPALIGCYGVVVKTNQKHPDRPVIILTTNKFRKKIKPVMIDTSKLAHITLKLLI